MIRLFPEANNDPDEFIEDVEYVVESNDSESIKIVAHGALTARNRENNILDYTIATARRDVAVARLKGAKTRRDEANARRQQAIDHQEGCQRPR